MSRGFVKEPEPDAPPEPLPEIPLPPPPNPVTQRGLEAMEATIAEIEARLSTHPAPEEGVDLRRKLRYWRARRATARLTAPPNASDEVGFGSTVLFSWPGRGKVRIEIVGEDESEPSAGRVSWRAPTAAALFGSVSGDRVEVTTGGRTIEIEILAVANGSGRSSSA